MQHGYTTRLRNYLKQHLFSDKELSKHSKHSSCYSLTSSWELASPQPNCFFYLGRKYTDYCKTCERISRMILGVPVKYQLSNRLPSNCEVMNIPLTVSCDLPGKFVSRTGLVFNAKAMIKFREKEVNPYLRTTFKMKRFYH